MILAELLIGALVVGVVAYAIREGRIVTPIPQSVVDSLRAVFAGSLVDTLWRIAIVAVLVALALVLFAGGGMFGVVGGFVAAILLSALVEDDIRDIVADLWNRNFWIWRVD